MMDSKTGLFTVAAAGYYSFRFNTVKAPRHLYWDFNIDKPLLVIRIVKQPAAGSGGNKFVTLNENRIHAFDWYSFFQMSVQATAELAIGDRVGVQVLEGILGVSEDPSRYSLNALQVMPKYYHTSFTGFMVQSNETRPDQCKGLFDHQ